MRQPGYSEETQIQCMVVEWIKLRYPDILFNAPSLAGNHTNARRGMLAKRMGYHRGWLDMEFMEPRKQFHGMILEVKAPKGKVSKDQEIVIHELQKRGYFVEVGFGFNDCIEKIQGYLG